MKFFFGLARNMNKKVFNFFFRRALLLLVEIVKLDGLKGKLFVGKLQFSCINKSSNIPNMFPSAYRSVFPQFSANSIVLLQFCHTENSFP